MAIRRPDRLHLALHMTYGRRVWPWLCRLLNRWGDIDCATFRNPANG